MTKMFTFLLMLLLLSIKCKNFDSGQNIDIKSELFDFKLVNHQKSLDGIFLLSPILNFRNKKSPSELLAFDNTGKVFFKRSFYNNNQQIVPLDFKQSAGDTYSYFFTYSVSWNCYSTMHFLNSNFKDLFLPISTRGDPELDCHDSIMLENGNKFLVYVRKEKHSLIANPEIQEINPSGEIIFSWKILDHLQGLQNLELNMVNPANINSISRSDKDELFLSLNHMNEILKVQHPSGKILARISSKDWKFVNDPLNGFSAQHSVRYLGNDHLLLFDNGDEKRNISRAVEYKIDVEKKEARLIWEFRSYFPNGYRKHAGSVQRLSNGNTLIGWGVSELVMPKNSNHIIFTEVSPTGKIIRELYSKQDLISYRVSFKERSSLNNN